MLVVLVMKILRNLAIFRYPRQVFLSNKLLIRSMGAANKQADSLGALGCLMFDNTYI
jgi:hypothetical protein